MSNEIKRIEQEGRGMNLAQRILITVLAFCVGVLLMPLTPFAMAWRFWGETDDDRKDGQ